MDRLGLVAALEWQAREIESRGKLTVELEVKGIGEPLDSLTSVTVFRIAQEALTNAVRHSRARTVWVDLHGDTGGLRLRVHNDGLGLNEQEIKNGSLGILGVRERWRTSPRSGRTRSFSGRCRIPRVLFLEFR